MKRLSLAVDLQPREEQAGFRRERGCIDHIFTLRNIIEQSTEWERTLHVNFVDFAKAFDCVHRHSLWKILRAYGIPSHLAEIIKASMTTLPAVLVMVTSYLMSDSGVSCPRCLTITPPHAHSRTQRRNAFAKQVGLHISSNTEYC